MYQARDTIEAGLIKLIADGDTAARQFYAKWLGEHGEKARAAFLHLDQAILHPPWRASLDGGWLDLLGVEWLRALGHEALQFSTWDISILPSQSVQITDRATYKPFQPQYLLISAEGTPRGAADWAVNDFRIGGFSQFYQSGDVPGDLFAAPEIDRYVAFKRQSIMPAVEVGLTVTYIGAKAEGIPFRAWLVGRLSSSSASLKTMVNA